MLKDLGCDRQRHLYKICTGATSHPARLHFVLNIDCLAGSPHLFASIKGLCSKHPLFFKLNNGRGAASTTWDVVGLSSWSPGIGGAARRLHWLVGKQSTNSVLPHRSSNFIYWVLLVFFPTLHFIAAVPAQVQYYIDSYRISAFVAAAAVHHLNRPGTQWHVIEYFFSVKDLGVASPRSQLELRSFYPSPRWASYKPWLHYFCLDNAELWKSL